MLRAPQFYMLYAMMLMAGIGGLTAVAQAASVAGNFGIGGAALGLALLTESAVQWGEPLPLGMGLGSRWDASGRWRRRFFCRRCF